MGCVTLEPARHSKHRVGRGMKPTFLLYGMVDFHFASTHSTLAFLIRYKYVNILNPISTFERIL